jgi:DNA mismatch repair protein MutS
MANEVLLKQYKALKEKHPDAVILLEDNNSYVSIGNDAKVVSELCNLPISNYLIEGMTEEIQLVSFKIGELDKHLHKLVREGKKVAICNQLR